VVCEAAAGESDHPGAPVVAGGGGAAAATGTRC
jgi:hypothetical protein